MDRQRNTDSHDGIAGDPGLNKELPPLHIDVTGMSMSLPEVCVEAKGRKLRFILDPALKQGLPMHAAAFFSKAVLSRRVFDYPRERRVAILAESPIDACYRNLDEVVRRFPLVFTHQRELLMRGAPFLPLMFGTNWLGIRDDRATAGALVEPIAKHGRVSFIGSLEHADTGAYRFRREVAEYALRRGGIDCYGKGIRPLPGKREAIAPYRFSIAMENASADHYFSEKLVDCLLLQTVPIYFGCPGIGELFDPRGMLMFQSLEELDAIIARLDDGLYEAMRPHVLANQRKVIDERWHNHHGLFSRLAEGLADRMSFEPPVSTGMTRRVARFLRRVAGNRLARTKQ